MTDSQEKNQKIDISRRGFTKIGASAPVLMTLVSRPVLGVNCLSEQMSGNLSQHGHESCLAGTSPGGWKNVGGNEGPIGANGWPSPYLTGTYSEHAQYIGPGQGGLVACGPLQGGTKNRNECYVGGTTIGQTVLAGLWGAEIDGTPMFHLIDNYTGNSMGVPVGHAIAALLNIAAYNMPPPGTYAIPDNASLRGLLDGSIEIPGGNITTYLASTWESGSSWD